MWRFEQRTFYVDSSKVKVILVCSEVLKWIWLLMNQNRLLVLQIQTLPLRMHLEWKEIIDIVCKTINGKS